MRCKEKERKEFKKLKLMCKGREGGRGGKYAIAELGKY